VVVTEVDGVVVGAVVLVGDVGDVVVGLVAGGTGAPVVSVTVDVLVETEEDAVAGARKAQAPRAPASTRRGASSGVPMTT